MAETREKLIYQKYLIALRPPSPVIATSLSPATDRTISSVFVGIGADLTRGIIADFKN